MSRTPDNCLTDPHLGGNARKLKWLPFIETLCAKQDKVGHRMRRYVTKSLQNHVVNTEEDFLTAFGTIQE